jgi:hypothetical protein
MAKTPPWAVFGANERGFDPKDTRHQRKHKSRDISGCWAYLTSGCWRTKPGWRTSSWMPMTFPRTIDTSSFSQTWDASHLAGTQNPGPFLILFLRKIIEGSTVLKLLEFNNCWIIF